MTAPALVVWGDADPYLPVGFADAYAAALGGPATVERIEGAGHWPWLDRPELVDRVVDVRELVSRACGLPSPSRRRSASAGRAE